MLRVYQSTSAEQAKQYYTDALSRQDYYVDGQEDPGVWFGKGARFLGLDEAVSQTAFARLCDNLHPLTGEKLTPRTRDDRTVGYDINFHAPKGVSILHALTGDTRIREAMEQAVQATMEEMEEAIHTRVRLGNKSEDRRTANLVWGRFTHHTTRPVDGVPDPHLHVHCFVFNATFDQEEARWKAAQFRQMVRDHPYYQAAYHARLAGELQAFGLPVLRNAKGWDLHRIDRDLVESFSRRTAEIEAECRRLGITDPAEKSEVGARTRAGKDQNLKIGQLRTAWQHRLTESQAEWLHRMAQEPGMKALREHAQHAAEKSAAERAKNRDEPPEKQRPGNEIGHGGNDRGNDLGHGGNDRSPDEQPPGLPAEHTPVYAPPLKDERAVTAREAVDHAIAHIYARKAVESDRRLAAEALRYGVADISPEQVWSVIGNHPELLMRTDGGERWITTREVHAEEKAVLDFAVEGRGTCVPLGKGHGGREGERYRIGQVAEREGFELNGPQSAAVEHLVSSRDRVMLLRGGAGTGKTTLLKEARAAIEHGGTRIFACAVTTDASRGVLREAGFRDACPVQKILTDRSMRDKMAGQVIWVDEAGMMGTQTCRKLFDLAESIDARVVLAGDIKQHAPVERGDAMGLIERRAGIRPAEVTEILRQSGVYKQAVAAVQKGRLAESVRLMDEMGAIREVRDLADPQKRHAVLADRYMDVLGRGQTALVVSPTHAEGRQVTGLIRDRLKESGRIEPDSERTFTRLKDLQWTDAQKADPHNYEPGMVVQYTQHCPGFAREGIKPVAGNTKARILAVDPEKKLITTEDAAGHRRPLPLHLAGRFQVFEPQELKLAVGDRIRVTRNARTMAQRSGKSERDVQRRVNNGTYYNIKGFTADGHIKLDNRSGWVLHKNFGHLTHGYCTTPQAVQGKSADVHLGALSAAALAASTIEQIYVMLSRGKKACELITDKRSAILDAMARLDLQRSATELMDDGGEAWKARQRAHAREVQRMRAFEASRQRLRTDRQRGVVQRATPDRTRGQRQQSRNTRGRQGGRDHPGLERER